MQYLFSDGTVITRQHAVAAKSRFTINVAEEDPMLASAAIPTIVTSANDVPIVGRKSTRNAPPLARFFCPTEGHLRLASLMLLIRNCPEPRWPTGGIRGAP
jgi:hypothetical protein